MTTAVQRTPLSAASSEIGTVLAQRYEVVRELGRGGMGVVYLCRDMVTGDRVALKRLRSPESGETKPEENWWFHQEARAVALLDHPAIVRARDFGQLADGSPFFVMDVLPGRSVHEWMHTTRMPWPVVWSMVDQVLAALAHAHARGVIHGDLKPSNVMLDLASPGRGPRAYVLDLGLAWLREYRHDSRLDGARAPEVAVHSGAGTVGWVAPEQIRRQSALVGPATDMYALGCVMYRVLSGNLVLFCAAASYVLLVVVPVIADDLVLFGPENVRLGNQGAVEVVGIAPEPAGQSLVLVAVRRTAGHARIKLCLVLEQAFEGRAGKFSRPEGVIGLELRIAHRAARGGDHHGQEKGEDRQRKASEIVHETLTGFGWRSPKRFAQGAREAENAEKKDSRREEKEREKAK